MVQTCMTGACFYNTAQDVKTTGWNALWMQHNMSNCRCISKLQRTAPEGREDALDRASLLAGFHKLQLVVYDVDCTWASESLFVTCN